MPIILTKPPSPHTSMVLALVSEHLGVPVEKLTVEHNMVTQLGADSLDMVELVMEVEGYFGIDILDEDAQKVQTIQSLIDLVDVHMARKPHVGK